VPSNGALPLSYLDPVRSFDVSAGPHALGFVLEAGMSRSILPRSPGIDMLRGPSILLVVSHHRVPRRFALAAP